MGFDKAGRVAYEHIYWDQASLLVQVGLLDPEAASCVRRGARPPAAGSKPACELNDRSSAAKAQIVRRSLGGAFFDSPWTASAEGEPGIYFREAGFTTQNERASRNFQWPKMQIFVRARIECRRRARTAALQLGDIMRTVTRSLVQRARIGASVHKEMVDGR